MPTGGFIERCYRPETPPGDQQVEETNPPDPYPPPFFLSPKKRLKRRFFLYVSNGQSFEFRCGGKPRKSACRHFPFSRFHYFTLGFLSGFIWRRRRWHFSRQKFFTKATGEGAGNLTCSASVSFIGHLNDSSLPPSGSHVLDVGWLDDNRSGRCCVYDSADGRPLRVAFRAIFIRFNGSRLFALSIKWKVSGVLTVVNS